MLLTEATAAYLDSLRAEGRSPRTVAAYAVDLAGLATALGPVHLEAVTPTHLMTWAAAPRGRSSANRARSAVRGLFGFAVRAWWLTRDPSGVLRVRATRPAPTRPLSADDEARLLGAMRDAGTWEGHRDALLVRTALATGLRVSSLVGLDVAGVGEGTLIVPVKGGHRMAVTIEAALAEELLEVAGDEAVFTTRSGRRLSVRQVQVRLAEWAARAGLPGLHPHQLRHTFGSRRYAETKDLRAVQVALGHRWVTTTQGYVGVG